MPQLDALHLAENVRQRMVDFAADDNFVSDARLGAICRSLWSGPPAEGGLLSELWVEGAFAARAAPQTLGDLADAGCFDSALCAYLSDVGAVPRDRPLFTHQAAAVQAAQQAGPNGERPALVITAGTGAGKTEAFLLPVLHDLWSQPWRSQAGMRCLILYPMNALVNDQVDRLHGWLRRQDRVTLFHFTGETPEDDRAANWQGIKPWDASRYRTRQQARGLEMLDGRPIEPSQRGPVPDIVITNYSMLEYMLCRPQDSVFFGPALRAVVLDEAHLYTGTLAAEITLLLRRLLLRCGRRPEDVLHFATSATLGSGAPDELRSFAATLFSKPTSLVHVIQGQPAEVALAPPEPPARPAPTSELAGELWLDRPLIEDDGTDNPRLAHDAACCERLRGRLPGLVSAARIERLRDEKRPAVLLYEVLQAAPIIHQLRNLLWERPEVRLSDLAEQLWQARDRQSVRATVALLQLAASARREVGHYPLLPHRLHVMVRAPEGLSVCLDANCSASEAERLPGLGRVSAGVHDHCGSCGAASLALFRCDNCGAVYLGA